jgi:hypothetical protein
MNFLSFSNKTPNELRTASTNALVYAVSEPLPGWSVGLLVCRRLRLRLRLRLRRRRRKSFLWLKS